MASATNGSSFYDYVFTDLADPRTNDWFLLSSPVPVVTLVVTYFLWVTVWGPGRMKEREPLDLNFVIQVYNLFQVLLSSLLVYEAMDGALLRKDYSIRCQPLVVERTKESMREANCIYVYFLAKITELLDTVFFVLRKKDRQVTFLHVYHHTVMPIISWGFAKYCPGGHVILVVAINSFVHVVMYLYYMLAALGPRFQKYLWWKKYLTMMQLIQFLLIVIHNIQLLFSNDCNYPKFSFVSVLLNTLILIVFFGNFYRKSYSKKKTGLSNKGTKPGMKDHEN